MRLYSRLCFLSLAALLGLTVAACDRSAVLPGSSSSAGAPTIVPTRVASAPTGTPVAKTGAPSPVADAFAKTRGVERVRYEITSGATLTQNGKAAPQNGLSAQGAESGENRRLTLSGIMKATGEAATFELVVLDGVTYIKGLNGIPGVNPAQWYRFPQESGNVSHDAPGVKSLLARLQAQDVQNADFQNQGSETVDGQTCAIWFAQDPELAQGLLGIVGANQAGNQLQAPDRAEFRVWTCADGYIHRLTGVVEGHDPSNPTQRATVQLTIHLFDHDGEVLVTVPENAQDFQVPMSDPSPTPNP